MVAVYDYDPLKQSPSKDKSKELNLRKGQYVTVIGDMVCFVEEQRFVIIGTRDLALNHVMVFNGYLLHRLFL